MEQRHKGGAGAWLGDCVCQCVGVCVCVWVVLMKLSSHHSKALIKSILQARSFSLALSFSYSLTFSFSLAGMDPNWRHIIPPGQKRVISEGQCIEDCTGYAFPAQGINIFAVMMRTHQIGKEVKLRQVSRGGGGAALPCVALPCICIHSRQAGG